LATRGRHVVVIIVEASVAKMLKKFKFETYFVYCGTGS